VWWQAPARYGQFVGLQFAAGVVIGDQLPGAQSESKDVRIAAPGVNVVAGDDEAVRPYAVEIVLVTVRDAGE
jgi:hypothetical protein